MYIYSGEKKKSEQYGSPENAKHAQFLPSKILRTVLWILVVALQGTINARPQQNKHKVSADVLKLCCLMA